jgi:hypothetical protein
MTMSSRNPARFNAFVGAIAMATACAAPVASERPVAPLLDSPAMNAMLRADGDKDGVLSREELDRYDLTLGPRFREADSDRDGKLTLHELDALLSPESEAVGATR